MATLIRTDGTTTPVRPAGATFTLAELQGYVGGWIEVLTIGQLIYVLHEEGKLNGLPLNRAATHRLCGHLLPGDYVVGDVLVCEQGELE